MEKSNNSLIVKKIDKKINKNELYIDDKKIKDIISDMLQQFEIIEESLNSISEIINKSINNNIANKSRIEAFRELKRKVKSQANSTKKLSDLLSKYYNEDLRNYPLKLLNDRIAEVERKLSELSK